MSNVKIAAHILFFNQNFFSSKSVSWNGDVESADLRHRRF